MHDIEPHYLWLDFYNSEEDDRSPFYGSVHSEFEFQHSIYNFVIHPQWDNFGSSTLYLKILFVDYDKNYCIIELIGEWNDTIHNDIMQFKREVLELIMEQGIQYFILVGENVLNFHSSDNCYYEEWFEDIDDGWIAFINFRDHVLEEFRQSKIDYYVNFGGELDNIQWRKHSPIQFFRKVEEIINKRLN